jgi:hypothetical protein
MGRKKEQPNLDIMRFTIQMNRTLYREIKQSALELEVKTYELVNRLVMLGARAWNKMVKNKEARIGVKGENFALAKKLETRVARIESKKSVQK